MYLPILKSEDTQLMFPNSFLYLKSFAQKLLLKFIIIIACYSSQQKHYLSKNWQKPKICNSNKYEKFPLS